MPEDKALTISVKCAHCNNINVIDLHDFMLDMRANHFHKMTCNKDECRKKTLVTYAFTLIPIEDNVLPQETFSTLTIEGEQK